LGLEKIKGRDSIRPWGVLFVRVRRFVGFLMLYSRLYAFRASKVGSNEVTDNKYYQ